MALCKSPAFTVSHPLYGAFLAQHLGFEFDNSEYNVTKITGTIVETIKESKISYQVDAVSTVSSMWQSTNVIFQNNINSDIPQPKAREILSMSQSANAIYNSENGFLLVQTDLDKLRNAYNSAIAYINTAETAVEAGVNVFGYLLFLASLPATFTLSVLNRLQYLQNSIASLPYQIASMTENEKRIWESVAGALNLAMYGTVVTNITDDYTTVDDVNQVIAMLTNSYNNYIINIDAMQSSNGGVLGGYVANAQNIQSITDTYIFTVNTLYDIAANSKKPYTVYLQRADNFINVAYKYLGLLPDDSTMDSIIQLNNLSLDELILMQQGRKILYYA